MSDVASTAVTATRSRAIGWWVVAIIGLSSGVRFYLLTHASIWSDEGFSLELIAYPLADIWTLSGRDVHPPLFYMLLHGLVALTDSNALMWTRGFSAVLGVVNVGFGIWLVRMVSTPRAAITAGLLLALLPIAVRYSQDVRMYALMGVELTGATLALVYWVLKPQKSSYLVMYVLLMVSGLYTHYFSIFCAFSHWLYLLLIRLPAYGRHRGIERPQWWLANGVIVLLYLPWLSSVFTQLNTFGVGWIQPVSGYSLPSAIWKFLIVNDGRGCNAFIYWLVPIVYVLTGAIVVWQDRSRYAVQTLIVICGFLTVIVVFLFSFYIPVFVERYLFFSAVMMPLLVAIALDKLRNGWGVVIAVGVLSAVEVFGLSHVYSQQHTMNNPYRMADDRLAELMEDFNVQSMSGDVLVVSDAYLFYAGHFYNDKQRKLLLLFSSSSGHRPIASGFSAPMMKYGDDTYVESLDRLETATGRVWWLDYAYKKPGDEVDLPRRWHSITQTVMGDNVLGLYEICGRVPGDKPVRCE
ncbi:MAG: glycosyltransferase family 39 protein [Pseudomonas gingeri]